MLSFLVRRLLYVPLIMLGVMVLTFFVSFIVQTPEQRARAVLDKRATPQAIANWLHERDYDRDLFINTSKPDKGWYHSIFFNQMGKLMRFDLGKSDTTKEPLGPRFLAGVGPSLSITLPATLVGLCMAVSFSLYLVLVRYSLLDRMGTIVCVILMSIVPMLYIFAGQSFMGLELKWFPVSGFDGISGVRFLLMPVFIFCLISLGDETRLYRTVFLEEIAQDYVRTARAKGVDNNRLLFTHVLKNGMISLITLVVAHLPMLVLGSLLMENFFGIPGLGNLLANALVSGDQAVINASVFVGALLYQGGLIATDICYAIADPRIRLGEDSDVETIQRKPLWKVLLGFSIVAAVLAVIYWIGKTVVSYATLRPDSLAGGFRKGGLIAWAKILSWFENYWVQNFLLVAAFVVVALFLYLSTRNEIWQRALIRLRRDRIGVVAGLVICAYLGMGALEAFQLSDGRGGSTSVLRKMTASIPSEETYSAPFATTILNKPTKLKGWHVLGTDVLGKDVLMETLRASRTALIIGGVTSAVYIPVGTLLGLAAGYFRRRTDEIITYLYSVVASVPQILLLVAIISALGKGFFSMTGALAFTGWVGLCRLIRGETLRQAGRQYIAAAQSLGQSHRSIITRHLLPNVLHLVFITFILGFSGLVMSEVILTYLGVGLPVGTPSWGAMIDGARSELIREPVIWWNLVAASTALFGLVLSLNLFGDSLRRAFDPKRS